MNHHHSSHPKPDLLLLLHLVTPVQIRLPYPIPIHRISILHHPQLRPNIQPLPTINLSVSTSKHPSSHVSISMRGLWSGCGRSAGSATRSGEHSRTMIGS